MRVCVSVCVSKREREKPDSLCFYFIFARKIFSRPTQKNFFVRKKFRLRRHFVASELSHRNNVDAQNDANDVDDSNDVDAQNDANDVDDSNDVDDVDASSEDDASNEDGDNDDGRRGQELCRHSGSTFCRRTLPSGGNHSASSGRHRHSGGQPFLLSRPVIIFYSSPLLNLSPDS